METEQKKGTELRFSEKNQLLGGIVDFYIPNASCMEGICVGATELCKKYCFGNCVFRHPKDPAKLLNTERKARVNFEITKKDSFVEEMNSLIQKTKNLSKIRIHSIGEFYNYEYFLKWMQIVKENPKIQFTAYVKNFSVLKKYKDEKREVPGNFNLLLSLYPDTYDLYKSQGGRKHVDDLIEELRIHYHAKEYVVCSREDFVQKVKDPGRGDYFCNGGTNLLLKWDQSLKKKKYLKLFTPGEGCDRCLKCYSGQKCPSGSKIYAVLRASSSLANISNAKERNK